MGRDVPADRPNQSSERIGDGGPKTAISPCSLVESSCLCSPSAPHLAETGEAKSEDGAHSVMSFQPIQGLKSRRKNCANFGELINFNELRSTIRAALTAIVVSTDSLIWVGRDPLLSGGERLSGDTGKFRGPLVLAVD